MKKLEILKSGLQLATSVGVGILAGNAIKMVKPNDLGLIKKICVGVGSLVLVDMASTKASDYVEKQVDDMVTSASKFIKGEDTVEPIEEKVE